LEPFGGSGGGRSGQAEEWVKWPKRHPTQPSLETFHQNLEEA
jgi:hypothetical protein